MRVSMLNMYTSNIATMQGSLGTIAKLEQQLSTGLDILRPSDDPIGIVKVLNNEENLAKTQQYMDNIDSLSDSLGRSEVYLTGIVDVQNRMRELTLQANNGNPTQEDRDAFASELENLRDSILDSINAQDESGNYIFSGNSTDTPAVGQDPVTGEYLFQGDNNKRDVQVSESTWEQVNVTAGEVLFGGAPGTDIFNQTTSFIETLRDPNATADDLADANAAMLDTLNADLDSIGETITNLGGAQNSLELTRSAHSEMELFSEEIISRTEAVDYPSAVSEMQMRLTSLQVAQQSFVKMSQLTLFNHM